jgi:hypothetical protein
MKPLITYRNDPALKAALTSLHARFPKELGWPLWLAYYEDSIFEGLPQQLAETWPRRLADAVPVGITIPDTVLADLQVWWLTHERFGVRNIAESAEAKGWIDSIAAFIRADSRGEATGEQRETADKAAWAASTRDDFYPALSDYLLLLLRTLEGPSPRDEA